MFLSKKSVCTRRSRKKKIFSDMFHHKLTDTKEVSVKQYGLCRFAKATRLLKSLIKFTHNILKGFLLDFCQIFCNLNQTSKACSYHAFSISSKITDCLYLAFFSCACFKFCNAMSLILAGNSLNFTLMFSFIRSSGCVQQWKGSIREKLLRSFGFAL